jgi:hypothetical protein
VSLASRLRQWLTVTLPQQFSAWLLQSYRRPVRLFLLVVALPFSLILGTTYAVSVSLWRAQTSENLRVMARLGSEILAETLDETLVLEQFIAGQPSFAGAVRRGDPEELRRALTELSRFMRRVSMLMVLNPEGRVLAAAPDPHRITGTSLAAQEPFQAMQRERWQPTVSGVYLREGPELEKVVAVGWPVYEEERLVGALLVEQRIEDIKSWLQKIRVEPRGFLYVVDQHDQLVVFPFQKVPGKPLPVSNWPPVAHPPGEHGGTLMFRSERTGESWLAGLYPVGRIGWRVVTVQPERAALKTLRGVLSVLGGLALAAIGLVALVGSRWLRVHAFSLSLLKQNANMLRRMQQQRPGGNPLLDDPEAPV